MKNDWFYLKCYLLKRSRSPQQGFTMLEVLAALMISFAFLMGTLNALAITALMQVKAERQAQATYWIQQDLEQVRFEATQIAQTTSACTGTFASNNSYGALLLERLRTVTTPTTMTNSTASPSVASVTKTISGTTYQGRRQAQVVFVTPNQSSTTFGANSTKNIVNREYRLVRIVEGYDNSPQILSITYAVGLPDNAQNTLDSTTQTFPRLSNAISSILATLYTELIPSQALSCS